ncbi:retrovirus-related pol polyprotein from transposon TNT 1-94 [Tanacetum coccineum]|uniref:Retrovirus-related pol polyprotein from transposon TNT 1-94 n=1 Tax=Tanacetum coccineum TaxID=301880 RepID=A0ABQ5JC71_9ASTR
MMRGWQVADLTNLETVVNVSPIPTSRIKPSHPSTLILGDPTSRVQTRSKVNKSSKAHAFVSYVQKAKENPIIRTFNIVFEIHKVLDSSEFLPYGKKAIVQMDIGRGRKILMVKFFAPVLDLKPTLIKRFYECTNHSSLVSTIHEKVYKVVKALYGLHQAPRAWYATLSTFLLKNGYRRVESFELCMKSAHIEMSSTGELTSSWPRSQTETPDIISSISQDKYVAEKSLKKFDFAQCLTLCLQSVLVSGLTTPKASPLKSSQKNFLAKQAKPCGRTSATTKLNMVAAEAEYVAAASCCGQVLWIQNQMLDYGFNFMNTKIYIDNESTICIVKNPVYHSKTKHIAIRHHFIRDAYEKKLIQVLKIHTNDNVADLLTKAFDVSRFHGSSVDERGKTHHGKSNLFQETPKPLCSTFLPIDVKHCLNVGYTFVNFTTSEAIWKSQVCIIRTSWLLFKSKKIAQVVRAWIQSKNSLVKHFEDMRLCRPSKEYLLVWFNPPRDVSMSCLTTKGMHTIGVVCTRFNKARVFWGADEEVSVGGLHHESSFRGYDGLTMQPVAPTSPDYVPGLSIPPSPDYVPGPEHPPSPIEIPFVPEPEYPEYLVPSEDEAPMEDQPLPADASPVALSPGYVPDTDPEEDPEEDFTRNLIFTGLIVLCRWRELVLLLRSRIEFGESSSAGVQSTDDSPSDKSLGLLLLDRASVFEVRFEEARDDRAYLGALINTLYRERIQHRRTALAIDREAIYARIAWTSSEDEECSIEEHVRYTRGNKVAT